MSSEESKEGSWDSVCASMNALSKELSKNRKTTVKTLQGQVASCETLAKFKACLDYPLHSQSTNSGILSVDISPLDQEIVATAGNDGTSVLFNHKSGKVLATLKGHSKAVNEVQFHPKDKILFTASADSTVGVWSEKSDSYEMKTKFTVHKSDVSSLGVHPSGNYLVSASLDKTWALLDVQTGRTLQQFAADMSGFTRVRFHPDGLILGTGTVDSQVHIFDVRSVKHVATFKTHTGHVNALTFSELGYVLATGDNQGTVVLWDLRTLKSFDTFEPSGIKTIRWLDFDQASSYLAVAGGDLRLYAVGKQTDHLATLADHTAEVTCAKWGTNAGFLVSTSLDKHLKLYSTMPESSEASSA